MFVVTNIYHSRIGDDFENIRAVRIRNNETGEENLLQPYELIEPYNTEIGDQFAYKVSFVGDRLFTKWDTKQYYDAEWDF